MRRAGRGSPFARSLFIGAFSALASFACDDETSAADPAADAALSDEPGAEDEQGADEQGADEPSGDPSTARDSAAATGDDATIDGATDDAPFGPGSREDASTSGPSPVDAAAPGTQREGGTPSGEPSLEAPDAASALDPMDATVGTSDDSDGDDSDGDDSDDAGANADDSDGDDSDDAGANADDAEPPTSPDEPYVPCSGVAPPLLTLTPVLEGLDRPIHAVTPNTDASVMYVVERGGDLWRFDLDDAAADGELVLSVDTVTNSECGFFSVALHPNFDGSEGSRLFVSYSASCGPGGSGGDPGLNLVEEHALEADGSASFVQTIASIEQPRSNHNGGLVSFGPDGYLYYGLGDGGGGNDQFGENGNGQNPNVPLGKLLRFDIDDLETAPPGNLTPEDVAGESVDSRIAFLGLRNPWRFSFDRETGDLYIGDVGQSTWEEISFARAGSGPLNFGWSQREGFAACPGCGARTLAAGTTATDPLYAYENQPGGSVTGGFVYRGANIPALVGRYLFGDYSRGTVSALTRDDSGVCDVVEDLIPNALPGNSLASFAQDAAGELYVMNMARGSILRIDAL